MTLPVPTARRLAIGLLAGIILLIPRPAAAQCPTWDGLLADESLLDITISAPQMAGLRMWFVYVTPATLGRCTLGDTLFDTASAELSGAQDRHVFWIGTEGPALHLFRLERIYMIQETRRYDMVGSLALDSPATVLNGKPPLTAEALIAFEGPVDFAEPVTVFYEGIMGSVPGEYWFPENLGSGR